jgi:hypothetical protein
MLAYLMALKAQCLRSLLGGVPMFTSREVQCTQTDIGSLLVMH